MAYMQPFSAVRRFRYTVGALARRLDRQAYLQQTGLKYSENARGVCHAQARDREQKEI